MRPSPELDEKGYGSRRLVTAKSAIKRL